MRIDETRTPGKSTGAASTRERDHRERVVAVPLRSRGCFLARADPERNGLANRVDTPGVCQRRVQQSVLSRARVAGVFIVEIEFRGRPLHAQSALLSRRARSKGVPSVPSRNVAFVIISRGISHPYVQCYRRASDSVPEEEGKRDLTREHARSVLPRELAPE